jgi:alcohol dehydrogenase
MRADSDVEERHLVAIPLKTMKALVYHGPGRRAFEDKPRPVLREPGDAIVRVTTSTICGTDLHILRGDVPEVAEGRILGHEGVGIVDEVGEGVRDLRKGDRVLISCITSCAKCDFCRRGMYSHCRTGGWTLGHTIDGTQAEYVRIPHAETSLHRLPAEADEDAAALLSDIFPTALECGVLNGGVRPGATVCIVGCGPIGLAALLLAQLYSPSEIIAVDSDANRLRWAGTLGANHVVNAGHGDVARSVMALTSGAGVDVVIEAVGTEAAFDTCQAVVAPGGVIANVGVHGRPVLLKLERLWAQNITLTTRLVDTVTTPMLLKLLLSRRLQPEKLITHRFKLAEAMRAYDIFCDAMGEHSLKVVLKNP